MDQPILGEELSKKLPGSEIEPAELSSMLIFVTPAPSPMNLPTKSAPLVRTESGNWASEMVPTRLPVFKLVKPAPLPLTLAAAMVPARNPPVPSRFTIVFGVFALVAALAATAPPATFAAVCPPTAATTVAPCVPVTFPANEPEKLVAVVAEAALLAVPAVAALPAFPA